MIGIVETVNLRTTYLKSSSVKAVNIGGNCDERSTRD